MASSKTHAFTSRGDGGDTPAKRKARKKLLKELSRPLTKSEQEELARLMQEGF